MISEYVQSILNINPNYDAELLEKAYQTATEYHKDQRRRSGEPYIIHPKAVAIILAEIGMDEATIAAGLLHDIVEDTPYTLEMVSKEFSPDIAMLVDGVTKLTNLVYESKEEKQAENIRKMFLAMSKDIRILVIKLADRLHNTRTIEYMPDHKKIEKCTETLEIYAPLAARLGLYAFKYEMENVSFQVLHPEAYAKLDQEMKNRNEIRSEVITQVIGDVRGLLDEMGIQYDIYGRSKHYYSIFKKMTFQNKNLDEIFDLTAIRVIVDSVQDCYAVLGAVHTRWKPIPGRFKDYIAMPKPNNYQSLHTTVIGDNGHPFEIQIRTKEMHLVAEYGIAAHWKYKEGIKSDDNESKLAWLRQSLEWQKDANNSKDFIETLKVDLFSSQVFVFTPKGDIIELPSGSTPLDFAFKIHTNIGFKCIGAKVNGKMVPIDYVLQNGEIIDIVTSSSTKGPSIDWLKIVKTNSAKNKIRQYLKKENKSASAEKGRDMLEKAVRKKGLDLKEVLKNQYVLKAAKAQNFSTVEDLYNAASYGGSVMSKTVKLCEEFYHEDIQQALKKQEEIKISEKKKDPKKLAKGVSVKGVSDLFVRFARCCNPVPGDEIIGFTTKGRGVAVHRADCVNMLSLPESDKARIIEVAWEADQKNMVFDCRVNIVAEDRKGLFAEVSKVCEDMDINITGINAKKDKSDVTTMEVTLAISSIKDIQKVMARFTQIKSVVDVYRNNS